MTEVNINCLLCDMEFLTAESYMEHIHFKTMAHKVFVNEGVYNCDCSRTFEHYQDFRLHAIQKHLKEPIVICDICMKHFGCDSTLRNHKLMKHSTMLGIEDDPLAEGICSSENQNDSNCTEGNLKTTTKLKSQTESEIKVKNKSKRMLYKYANEMEKPFQCKLCHFASLTKKGIQVHLSLSHKKESKEMKKLNGRK